MVTRLAYKVEEFSAVVGDVLNWAYDRNLIEGSTPQRQMIKLHEELGEFLQAVHENNLPEIYDAIGDMAVVVLIVYEQLCQPASRRSLIPSMIRERYSEVIRSATWVGNSKESLVEDALRVMHIVVLDLEVITNRNSALSSENEFLYGVMETLELLNGIATVFGSTLGDCLSKAYQQIKDRKGKMIDGIFVKEADLTPRDVVVSESEKLYQEAQEWLNRVDARVATLLDKVEDRNTAEELTELMGEEMNLLTKLAYTVFQQVQHLKQSSKD